MDYKELYRKYENLGFQYKEKPIKNYDNEMILNYKFSI